MIPDDPKFWWEQDVKFCGQPKVIEQNGIKKFLFKGKEYYHASWFVSLWGALIRYPFDDRQEVRHWMLTDKQIKAFNQDWEKFHNGQSTISDDAGLD